MSIQNLPPADHALRRRIYTKIAKIDINIEKPYLSDHTSDMATWYHLPKELDFGIGRWEDQQHDERRPSTKVLHEEEDGKPAITLTTYVQGHPSRTDIKESLLDLFKPIDPSPFNETPDPASTIKASTPQERYSTSGADVAALAVGDASALLQLRSELKDHFRGLTRGFEEKTGRGWTPLRAWAKEEWEWESESENEGEDGAGVMD
jgi:hypothetical protein